MSESEAPISGQCAIFKRADGRYDVLKFGEGGTRTSVREKLKQLADAYHVARKQSEAGRVLYCDHATPDVFEKYTFSK